MCGTCLWDLRVELVNETCTCDLFVCECAKFEFQIFSVANCDSFQQTQKGETGEPRQAANKTNQQQSK